MALCLSGRGNFRLINTVFFSVVFKFFFRANQSNLKEFCNA